jgi:hypothetical protein
MLTDDELLHIVTDCPAGSPRQLLTQVARAIEAKVLEKLAGGATRPWRAGGGSWLTFLSNCKASPQKWRPVVAFGAPAPGVMN